MKRKSLAKILTMTMIASIVTSLCPATLYAATGSEVAEYWRKAHPRKED